MVSKPLGLATNPKPHPNANPRGLKTIGYEPLSKNKYFYRKTFEKKISTES